MLTPEYLQGAPMETEELFLKLEEEIIADICRRIAKTGMLTDTAEHELIRMRELGAGTDYLKKEIEKYSGLSAEAVDRLFFDAGQTSSEFYEKVYKAVNKDYTPFEYNDFLQQTMTANVNQTKGELRNMTASMGFSYRGSNGVRRFHPAAEAYRDCLDYAYTQVSTGMTDYITAVRNATKRLTESGLQCVDYASEHVDHIDVAARRAILTGLSQMTGEVSKHNAAELDTDIVEVDAHAGARPDHAEWQGRWYSLSGKSKEYPSLVAVTGYGTGAGLKGWNCRHDFYPVIPGISEPSYTEEELKNIDPPPFKDDNGKTYTYYEATQRQRAIERAIRKTKRELLGAKSSGDEDSFMYKSVLLRRQREEYERFSKKAGLLTQNERTQVYGFGRSEASKAAWAAKKAAAQTAAGGSSSGGAAPAVISVKGGSNGGTGKDYTEQNISQKGLTGGARGGIINSKNERGIENNMKLLSDKHTAAGNRKSPLYLLSEHDIEIIKKEILAINADVNDFVFNSDHTRGTCFLASDGKIHIKGNIFPDEYSDHPRDKMSVRAVLAHEYYGHKPYREQYLREDNDTSPDAINKIMSRAWADEFRASYMAAKNAPNLSDEDRRLLILDALSRADEAGISIKYNEFIRGVLYGTSDHK